jgi:hypothetical protein
LLACTIPLVAEASVDTVVAVASELQVPHRMLISGTGVVGVLGFRVWVSKVRV